MGSVAVGNIPSLERSYLGHGINLPVSAASAHIHTTEGHESFIAAHYALSPPPRGARDRQTDRQTRRGELGRWRRGGEVEEERGSPAPFPQGRFSGISCCAVWLEQGAEDSRVMTGHS
ncbi:unnamed protein product [Pleuronectes platessa]|uniref:Uncharacterized protein n=1 Tax=Pleuronectes platessa TaxID=8262 RepID=A0A9N7VJZ3_PLEPL|nr:unnamed protein product [Pleuronectes platessa]